MGPGRKPRRPVFSQRGSYDHLLLQANLRAIVQMKPSFLHLGEKGVMMLCRYMSTSSGFKFLTEANYTMNELKKWHNVSSIFELYSVFIEHMENCY